MREHRSRKIASYIMQQAILMYSLEISNFEVSIARVEHFINDMYDVAINFSSFS